MNQKKRSRQSIRKPASLSNNLSDKTERKKAEEYLHKEAERGNLLLELYEKAPQLTEKQLYDYTLEHVVKLTDSAIGFFHLVSDDQKNIILTTWNSEALKNCTAVYDTHYPIDSAGNWVDCVRLKRPVIYNDFANSPNRKGLPEGHSPVRRFMSIPVMEGDKVRIIFGVGNKIEEYDKHDVIHIQLVANELQKIIKQRHAEEALKVQYSTLHSIIDSTDALVFSVDRQYCYTSFNKGHAAVMKAIYGAEIEINHSLLDYMTVMEDREKAKRNIDRALAGESHIEASYSGEEKLSRLYFEISHNSVFGEDGSVIGVVVFAQDITERKQAEEALQKAHEDLQRTLRFNEALLSATPTPVFYKDEEGRYLGCNRAFSEFMGVTSDQIKGKTVYELWPSEHAKVYHIKDLELMRNPARQIYEFKVRDKDGLERPVIYSKDVFRDENDQVAGIVGAFIDITERKRTEEALKKSVSRLNEAQRIAHIGSWELDIVNNILTWSDEIYQMFEIDPKRFGASYESFLDAIHPDDRDAVNFAYTNSIKTRTPYAIDHRLRFADGRIKYVHEECETFYDADDKPLLSIGTVQDITERKLAEMEIAHVNRTLLMLSDTNQALIRTTDEVTLLNEVCQIAVDVGGYRMAWVGFAEHDEDKALRPIAHAGFESGYVESAKVTWGDNERGRGPGGTAIRTGKPCIVRNIPMDPTFAPWREAAIQHGYKSVIALPLISEDLTLGALGIYSNEVYAFDTKEVEILKELASDLAFGITTLRMRAKRDEMEEALLASEEKFKNLASSAQDSIIMMDDEEKFFYWNEAFEKLFQYKSSEITGKVVHALIMPKRFHDDYEKGFAKYLETGEGSAVGKVLELAAIKKNGDEFPVELSLSTLMLKGKRMSLGILRDITERKRAEEEILERKTYLETIMDSSLDLIFTVKMDGTFGYANKKLFDILGYKFEDIQNRHFLEFIPKKFHSVMQEKWLEIQRGVSSVYETQVIKADGSIVDCLVSHTPIKGLNEYLGILKDITERKQAEEEIKMLSTVVEQSTEGIAIANLGGNLTFINEAWCKMHGYESSKELLGKNLAIFHNQEQMENEVKPFNEKAIELGAFSGEVGHITRDGKPFPTLMTTTVLKNKEGKPYAMTGIAMDITERKRAELLQNAVYRISQASDKAANLGELYKSVHEIIGTVMSAKNFYIALYDKEKDLINYSYFVDEVESPPSPVKPGKGLTEYVLCTGKPLLCDEATDMELRRRGEVEVVGATSAIWLGVPLIVENKTIGVMVIQHYTDSKAYSKRELLMFEYVSSQVAKAIQRKRAEENIRMLSSAMEQSPASIVITDLEGKIEYVNPKFTQVTGYAYAEALGQKPSLLKSGEKPSEDYKQLWETITSGKEWRGEFHNKKKNGALYWESASISPIKDASGKTTHYLAVKEDITEKKLLESQFLRSQRMESIGTLASGIAHDLNNVLAPIMLSIEVLRKRTTDETGKRMLETIESSAKRGSDIVKQVLTFSRGAEGERVLLQPKHLIDEIVKIAKETFPRSIEIQADVPRNLWALLADPTQIHQVLLNVCVNARDAMPKGGKLTIKAENIIIDEQYACMDIDAKPGQYVVIAITDTGIGISPKILNKIFEPFFTTKEVGKGTGLGLSTTHTIVKNHGGFIHVNSEVGKGTTFKIYLPASMKHEVSPKEEIRVEMPVGHGETILVVDDEASVREMSRNTLETYGYKVIAASDGMEALSIYAEKKNDISIVLMDMMMPIMGGYATIKVLKKMNPQVLIIPTSGLPSEIETVKSLIPDLKLSLLKPYTAEKLLGTLNRAITE
jgi:PAS domain S-box-containing protein